MNSRRLAKVAHAIREQVSTTVLFELRDPRIKDVTVLSVEVSPDLRSAKVHVSIMGDEKAQSLCLHGLNSARGFIQSKVADRIQTRFTPILQFVNDQGIKKSIEAARVIRDALASDPVHSSAESGIESELEAPTIVTDDHAHSDEDETPLSDEPQDSSLVAPPRPSAE